MDPNPVRYVSKQMSLIADCFFKEKSGKERIKSEPRQRRLWKCVDILGMCSANLIPLNSDSMQTLSGQINHNKNDKIYCPWE
jgi:hypothetical protein